MKKAALIAKMVFIVLVVIFLVLLFDLIGNFSDWAGNGRREVGGKVVHYETKTESYTTDFTTQKYVGFARGYYKEMTEEEKENFMNEYPDFWDDIDEFLVNHPEYRYDFAHEPDFPQIWKEGEGRWFVGLSKIFLSIYGGGLKWRLKPAVQAAYQTSWVVCILFFTVVAFVVWRRLRAASLASMGTKRTGGNSRGKRGFKPKEKKVVTIG